MVGLLNVSKYMTAKAFEQSLAVLRESVVTVNGSRLRISVRGSSNHKPWGISPTCHIFKQSDLSSHTQTVRFAQLRFPPGWPAHYSSRGGRGDVFFSCTEEAQYPVPAKRSNTAQSRPGAPGPLRSPNAAETKARRLSEMVIYEVCVHLYLRLLKACYCLSKSRDLMGRRDGSHLSGRKVPSGLARAFYWRSIFFHKPIVVTCSISSFCQLGFLFCRRGPRRRQKNLTEPVMI